MNRQPEVELLPAAQAFGLGVVPYSPIARGVLAGKYKVNQKADPGSRAGRQDKRMLESEWRPESLMIAEKLKEHAEARGTSLIAWAVAWVLNNRAITATIAGPRTFEQWTSYFPALDYKWTAEDEALAEQPGGAGPRLHPRLQRSGLPGRGPLPGGGVRSSRRSSPGSAFHLLRAICSDGSPGTTPGDGRALAQPAELLDRGSTRP